MNDIVKRVKELKDDIDAMLKRLDEGVDIQALHDDVRQFGLDLEAIERDWGDSVDLEFAGSDLIDAEDTVLGASCTDKDALIDRLRSASGNLEDFINSEENP